MKSSFPEASSPSDCLPPPPAEFLDYLLNSLSEPTFVLNHHHCWVLVNDAFCQFMGQSRTDLIGQTALKLAPRSHQFRTHNEQTLATGHITETPEQIITPDGLRHTLTLKRSRFIDSKGNAFLVAHLQTAKAPQPSEPASSAPSQWHPLSNEQALLRALPDLVMRMTGDGVYLDFIPTQTFKVFGSQDLVGTRIEGSLPDELTTRRMHYIRAAIQTGDVQIYEQDILVDGEMRTEEVRIVISGDNEVLVIVRDMTERKRTELALAQLNNELEARIEERTTALRESEARFRTLVNNLPFGCWASDVFGRHIMQNAVSIRQWGNVIGQRPQDLDLPTDVLNRWLANNARVLAGDVLHLDHHYIEHGKLTYYKSIMAPIWDSGEIRGFLGVDIDITPQKHAEEAMRQNEERLRLILENMPVMMNAFDENGCVRMWNSECERVTGYKAAEIIDNPHALKRLYPDRVYRKQVIKRWKMLGNHFRNQEWEITCKDGSQRTILWSNLSKQFPIAGWSGWSVGIDISDRKQMEEALRQSEEKTRALLSVMPDMLFCYNREGIHVDFSPSTDWNPMLEPEQFLGKSVFQVLPAKPAHKIMNAVRQALDSQTIQRIEYRLEIEGVWHDYEARVIAMDGERVLAIVRDISDRKQKERQIRDSEQQLRQQAQALTETLQKLQKAQLQLVQSEKMSSLGQLVAGVAHEINNPVNFIFGNVTYVNEYIQSLFKVLQLYQAHYPAPVAAIQAVAADIDLDFILADLPKTIASMRVGAERIQAIVASLRTFSRMDEAEMKAVNIHDGLDSTLMILQSRLKATPTRAEIRVEKHYASLPLIECYAGQLNQVFMNLLSNAIDALEERAHQLGTAAQSAPNHPQITIWTEAIAADQIRIRIADNGPGIPAHLQQRLFDPFFTTKEVGKGTGMGLSISYQIVVERHGGSLECLSTPGHGAEFWVEIPIVQSPSR